MKITKILYITILISAIFYDHIIGMKKSQNTISELSKSDSFITTNWYKSSFIPPNNTSKNVLKEGQILGYDEEPHQMIERVVSTIAFAEKTYKGLQPKNILSTSEFAQKLGNFMDDGTIVFSTPILTNAGRFYHRPLSACVMPSVNLNKDLSKVKEIVDQYHQDGMGTGFDLSDANDPISVLKYLNNIAIQGANSKNEQRPVGNMAILNIDSSFIEKFINIKVDSDELGEEWKFNISVNITDDFMNAVQKDKKFQLLNGKVLNARKLLEQIANAAHKCGDPGLISIERLNKDNPTPLLSSYKCTAPCAEVGLAPGETCVFGYINLAKFVNNLENYTDNPEFNFDKLKDVVKLLTRALDNILEISIQKYLFKESKKIMCAKRKISIGVCGFADALILLNLSYCQEEARYFLQDILNFISYYSKKASVELAKERGSFSAIKNSRYMKKSFIIDKYSKLNTPHVLPSKWIKLAKKIKQTQLLRNATTTALPPTGRSALIIGASTGIEPLFSLSTPDGIHPALNIFLRKKFAEQYDLIIENIKKTGRCPKDIKHNFITATEISPNDHINMVIAAQSAIDEAISKTINLPEGITPQEIADIYYKAYNNGLKGISVFRDNSRLYQPKELQASK